jgi:general nucleoside transport system ATP-binding protein
MAGQENPAVVLKDITKKFPGLTANDHVSLELSRGEIRCLLGENGAGKSTLMNVLYGLYRPEGGQIFINGQEVKFHSPRDAMAVGLGMVHQHFMLIPVFNAIENIILGLNETRRGFLDTAGADQKIHALARKYDLDINTKVPIWQMGVGEQQRVEIIKALYRGARILILDEPTSVLTPKEVELLFVALRSLTQDGCTVIFITHKLWEATEISDAVTVMRGGKVVATLPTRDTDARKLAQLMVGREVLFSVEKIDCRPGEPILEIEDVHAANDKGLEAVRGVDLTVHCGEILGIAGVAGNGQRELAEAIFNMRHTSKGRIRIGGHDITNRATQEVIGLGAAYVPEDRIHQGAAQELSLQENLILKNHENQPFSSSGWLHFRRISEHARTRIKEYNVMCNGPQDLAGHLSGGNLQKLILARELGSEPKLIVAEQPTNGLDVGATEFVHQRLIEARDHGAGVMLISADLDEILKLADRVAVMFEGEIAGVVEAKDANISVLGEWMTGHEKVARRSVQLASSEIS